MPLSRRALETLITLLVIARPLHTLPQPPFLTHHYLTPNPSPSPSPLFTHLLDMPLSRRALETLINHCADDPMVRWSHARSFLFSLAASTTTNATATSNTKNLTTSTNTSSPSSSGITATTNSSNSATPTPTTPSTPTTTAYGMPGRRVVSNALLTMVLAGQPQAAMDAWRKLNHRCYGSGSGPGLATAGGSLWHEVVWPLGQAAVALGNRQALREILLPLLPSLLTGQGKGLNKDKAKAKGDVVSNDDDDVLASLLLSSTQSSTTAPSQPSQSNTTTPHPLLSSPEAAATGVCWMLSQGRQDLALALWRGHCNNYNNNTTTTNTTTTTTNNNNGNNNHINRISALVLDMVCRSALLRTSPAYNHLNHNDNHNNNSSNNNTNSSSSNSSTNNSNNSNDAFLAASADFCAHILLQPATTTTTGATLHLAAVPGLSDRFVLPSV